MASLIADEQPTALPGGHDESAAIIVVGILTAASELIVALRIEPRPGSANGLLPRRVSFNVRILRAPPRM